MGKCIAESPFFHDVEPRAPNAHACALGWESERRSERPLRRLGRLMTSGNLRRELCRDSALGFRREHS